MRPYKLKHVPTGLYYQPHKHRGSNLSTRGKIYQTGTNGLSSARKYAEKYKDNEQYQLFPVYVEDGSNIHKTYIDKFDWQKTLYSYSQLKAYTNLTDWEIEYI